MASQIDLSADADGDLQRAAAASEAALTPYAILGTPPEAEFDNLTQLAADLCDVPVALLNLFARDHQWFKAKVGFEGSVPPIEESLCRHAIDSPDVLVIPDLAADQRTRGDAVVAAAPNARFYAGAPLRTPDGVFLGTLCIIDFAPRPDGLSRAQADGLRTVAAQVMSTLELRRLVAERDSALGVSSLKQRQLASTAAQWRGLFQGLREGFMLGAAIRDDAGTIVDWDHLEVNQAFLDVIGFTNDRVIGRTVRELAPDIPQSWIDFTAHVVETGTPATFQQVGTANRRLYDGRTFPIGGDQFATIFLDVTDRVRAEARQTALVAIADQLRDLDRLDDMTQVAARIVGETLRVSRAGYGRLDTARETIALEPDWTAPGVASIAGVHRFADYGDLLNELLAGELLVIDDVATDPRTEIQTARMRSIGTAALVNMPIRERGRTVAIFIVHSDQPRRWTPEELVFLRDVAERLELAIARIDQDTRRILQNQEMSHRVKNTLAIVQAIASQTLKPVSERAVVDNFERRITALATAHDVLLGTDWEAAPLDQVVRSVLDSAGQDGRVKLTGGRVDLSPRAVLSASLLVHELATNAAKYGALSSPAGTVTVDWRIQIQNGRPHLIFEWVERGGPTVVAPTRRGFGSRLINMGLVGTGGVDLDYSPVGLTARMSAPVDDLTKT